VGRERLGAPDDGALVGLLEAEIERERCNRELDLERLADLGRNIGPPCPEALDSLGCFQRLEHPLGCGLDIEAEQDVGHGLDSFHFSGGANVTHV
jgi:hypothetical protein